MHRTFVLNRIYGRRAHRAFYSLLQQRNYLVSEFRVRLQQ